MRFTTIYLVYVVLSYILLIVFISSRKPKTFFAPIGWAFLILTLPLFLYYGFWLRFSVTPLVDVPSVVGLSVAQASRRLTSIGLHLAGTSHEDADEGMILEQSPAHGVKVRRGREIRVHVRKRNPWVQVPALMGKSVGDAAKMLHGMGLLLSGVSTESHGVVVYQYPAPGIRLERSGSVEVGISE